MNIDYQNDDMIPVVSIHVDEGKIYSTLRLFRFDYKKNKKSTKTSEEYLQEHIESD